MFSPPVKATRLSDEGDPCGGSLLRLSNQVRRCGNGGGLNGCSGPCFRADRGKKRQAYRSSRYNHRAAILPRCSSCCAGSGGLPDLRLYRLLRHPHRLFPRPAKSGVHCTPFNPPPFRNGITWFDKRDHRKIALIDNRVAFTGGLNIGDEYAGGQKTLYWRDLGIRIEGSAVQELRCLFCENWQTEATYQPLCSYTTATGTASGDDQVAIVSGGPHHNRSRIRAAFRMAIVGATASIRIETPYFVPGPRFIRGLLRAVQRGVKVQLILPAKSDVPLVRLVNRSSYAILIRGGIEVYELGGTVLHGKVMLIDGRWSVIGSANLDQRSFHRNFEVNVIVSSSDFGRQVDEMFTDDLAHSRRISLEEHERRGFAVRLLEWLAAPISWFL